MDGKTFDHLVTASATVPTRRAALAMLMGGAVALVRGQGADARKRKPKPKGCTKSQKKCGETCIPSTGCCTDKDCVYCAGEVCQPDHTCRCNPGTSQYNGVCGVKPDCLPSPYVGGPGPSACCSGKAIRGDGGYWACLPGKDKCLSDYDCTTGTLGRCKGFMCPELYHHVTDQSGGCPFPVS